jgi:hypothetical protein
LTDASPQYPSIYIRYRIKVINHDKPFAQNERGRLVLIYWSRARASTETMEMTATIFGYDGVQHVLDVPDGPNSNTITFGSAKHGIDTLLIPNLFAAASFLVILVQWAYKKWIQSKGKESVAGEQEDEFEADGYRWKEGEDRILAWNVGRCTGCIILLGTSVWQVVSGK